MPVTLNGGMRMPSWCVFSCAILLFVVSVVSDVIVR